MSPVIDEFVAVDATAVHPTSGGAGTYLRAMISALSNTGIAPLVLARRNDTTAWGGASRVERIAPPGRPLRLAWEQLGLVRALQRMGPDITVLHSPHYTMPERVPSRLARVVTVHDLTMLTRPQDHQRAKRLLFARAVRLAAERADAIICVSRATADALVAHVNVRARIHVVPHGVDTARFSSVDPGTDSNVRSRYGLHHPFILHLGTIEPRKRVDLLMRAYDRLGRSDVELVLVGGAWPGVAERLPATTRTVHRLGFIGDDDVAALLRSAAVVAYPSAEEGFGLPILEALACGTAVVTTSGGATEEAAAGAAILVDAHPTDSTAAERVLVAGLEAALDGAGPSVSQRLAAASARTWASSAEGHAQVYRSLR